MTLDELRTDLRRILAKEDQPRPDWRSVERLCLKVTRRLKSERPEPDYPHVVVDQFLEDFDIREKDGRYARWERDRLKAWLAGGRQPVETPRGPSIVRLLLAGLGRLLAPIGALAAAIARFFSRPRTRTAEDLAGLIEAFLDQAEDGAWVDLESVRVADPKLESLRLRAVKMGSPDTDEAGLRALVAELRGEVAESPQTAPRIRAVRPAGASQ